MVCCVGQIRHSYLFCHTTKLPFHPGTIKLQQMQNQIYKGGRDQEIIELFIQTFSDSEGKKEGLLIGDLIRNLLDRTPPQDLRVFLSAEQEQVTGGVFFSRMRFENSATETWLLSPAAVQTRFQGMGVGQNLIRFAQDCLREAGVEVVVTYGDINFYSKVGYRPISVDIVPSPQPLSYPEGWIAQSLRGEKLLPISGRSFCVEAINDPVYW